MNVNADIVALLNITNPWLCCPGWTLEGKFMSHKIQVVVQQQPSQQYGEKAVKTVFKTCSIEERNSYRFGTTWT